MNRRHFLLGAGAALAAGANIAFAQLRSTVAHAPVSVTELQQHWRDFLAPGAQVATDVTPIARTDEQWRGLLSPLAYEVLRHEGTERPWSSPLDAEKRSGIFVCAGCSLALFSSAMKFDSGTGWPSFFTTIPGVFATKVDTKLIVPRTEYHCVKCGGHQGHVFDDGPRPTGLRYCNDGVALRFIPVHA